MCDSQETLAAAQSRGSCFWSAGQPADLALVPELQQCLQGKKVYVVGTSVSRNWYFQILQLMSANDTSPWMRSPGKASYRAAQKAACGGGVESSRDACKEQGVAFRWQNQNIHDDDLAEALRSGGYDIVIANMGLGNIVHHPRDWAGRLMQHGKKLAALVATLPSSTRFYWRTTTHICPHGSCENKQGEGFRGCGVPAQASDMIDMGNIVLSHLLLQRDPRVKLLNVMPLTNCSHYEDHVHHPHLTIDQVLLFLSKECPQLTERIVQVCPHLCETLTQGMSQHAVV